MESRTSSLGCADGEVVGSKLTWRGAGGGLPVRPHYPATYTRLSLAGWVDPEPLAGPGPARASQPSALVSGW